MNVLQILYREKTEKQFGLKEGFYFSLLNKVQEGWVHTSGSWSDFVQCTILWKKTILSQGGFIFWWVHTSGTSSGALYIKYQADTNLPEKSLKTGPFTMEYI